MGVLHGEASRSAIQAPSPAAVELRTVESVCNCCSYVSLVARIRGAVVMADTIVPLIVQAEDLQHIRMRKKDINLPYHPAVKLSECA